MQSHVINDLTMNLPSPETPQDRRVSHQRGPQVGMIRSLRQPFIAGSGARRRRAVGAGWLETAKLIRVFSNRTLSEQKSQVGHFVHRACCA
jgi:hypothetical protein